MTAEEIKARLMEAEAEDADRAGIYSEVADSFAAVQEELTSATAKIEELTGRVGQLTDTNFKLLEKIRYVDSAESAEEEDSEEVKEMTLEELFAED